nr:MAG TPA: hypothetical protein [Caudoviricetes sp.]
MLPIFPGSQCLQLGIQPSVIAPSSAPLSRTFIRTVSKW